MYLSRFIPNTCTTSDSLLHNETNINHRWGNISSVANDSNDMSSKLAGSGVQDNVKRGVVKLGKVGFSVMGAATAKVSVYHQREAAWPAEL